MKATNELEPKRQDLDVVANVRLEQMHMLFEGGLPSTVAATVFAFAFAWHLQGSVPNRAIGAWLLIKVLVAAPRLVHGAMYRRRKDDRIEWLTQARFLLLLDGLAWGAAGVLMMSPQDVSGMTVLVATLCGVATISTFKLQSDWLSCLMFTGPMLAIPIGSLLLRADSFGGYGSLWITIYALLLLTGAYRSEKHIFELLTLRFSNAKLTNQISADLEKVKREGKAKDTFVASMSHELRTPLHGIIGLARSLQLSVPPRDKETVRLIRRSGDHLLELINNVLEVSRFEAHGIDINSQAVDFIKVVEDVVSLCKPTADERGLVVSLKFAVKSPFTVMIDAFRVRQILLNLIGNAMKFTDSGGSIKIRVSVQEGGPRKLIAVSVIDTGIGMSAAQMEKLFEPFSQVDNTTTRRHGGTGLGLNITRAICEEMGGNVSCKSTLGRGSTFTATLPLQCVSEQSASLFIPVRPDSIFSQERFGASVVVLLAEDNEVNAIVGEHSLKRLGIEVVHASNGAETVQAMCTNGPRPDMVLLDCQMPVMDGFEAARLIRAYELAHGLTAAPIVALTANVFQSDRDACREAGMDAFLGKPFTDAELRDALTVFSLLPPEEGRSDSSYAALLL